MYIKDKETIQILTQIVRNSNDAHQPIKSTLVNETMKDYLNNLSNLVIDSVNNNNSNTIISEDETETSIRETVTVEVKNNNGLFCVLFLN